MLTFDKALIEASYLSKQLTGENKLQLPQETKYFSRFCHTKHANKECFSQHSLSLNEVSCFIFEVMREGDLFLSP